MNLPLIFNTPARALFFVTGRLFGTSTHDDTFYTEGTGFIYEASRTPGEGAPILITARHVIEGATDLTIRLIRRDKFGAPKFGEYQDIELGGASAFTHHPNPSIDISACRLAGPLRAAGTMPNTFHLAAFNETNNPTMEESLEIDAIEEVAFIGYPDGQYDRTNHTPVARRGTIATPIQLDWSGAPHFLIDATIFEGSSGSPVVLIRPAGRISTDGNTSVEPRVILLGVVSKSIETHAAVVRTDTARTGAEVRLGLGLGLVEKWTSIEETVDALFGQYGMDRSALNP